MAEGRWWNEPTPEKTPVNRVSGPPKDNQYAAIALVCAIVSLFIPIPLVMVGLLATAVVFGVMGLDYAHRKGAPGGMAVAALIVSVVGFMVSMVVISLQ